MQHLIVIIGPTASGKSELAVKIAQKYNGEIISADSRQVYRGLNIGTAKVKGKWHHLPFIPADAGIQTTKRKNTGFPTRFAQASARRVKSGMTIQRRRKIFIYKKIPHHCIDFVSPRKTYSVAEFQQCAAKAIRAIARRGKIPIVVGGTGLWIDALVYDWRLPRVAPDKTLRTLLEKKSAAQLFAMLVKLDPRRSRTVEQKNQRRLIRAIEIARSLGSVSALEKFPAYDALWIGLNPAPATLEKRIKSRVQKMIAAGLIDEIKKLKHAHNAERRITEFGFEYRAGLDYLDGILSKIGLPERLAIETRQYAKRQMTWFKRNPDIIWNPPAREINSRITSLLPDPIGTGQKRI